MLYKVQCKAIGGFKLRTYIILVFVFKEHSVCSVKNRRRGRGRSREDLLGGYYHNSVER